MKNKMKKFISLVVIMVLATNMLSANCVQALDGNGNLLPPDNIQSIRKSNTSIRVQWRTIPNADGYIIYRQKPSSKKYVKVHMVASSEAGIRKRWMDKKLKKNKVYKYKIASYRNVNGKQEISSLSDWVSAKTYERRKKKINARAPKVSKKEIYLGLCSSKKISCYVLAAKYGKHKKKEAFSTKVRWKSSDTSVATVDKKGNITARAKTGSCHVYAIAHNGTRTKIKVIVKNYAKVKEYYNYNRGRDIYTLITDYKTPMQNIAEYYSIHRLESGKEIKFWLNDEAEVMVMPQNADIGDLREDIETLLIDFPFFIKITVCCDSVEYRLNLAEEEKVSYRQVEFLFDNNCSQWQSIQIASHWIGYRFYPV